MIELEGMEELLKQLEQVGTKGEEVADKAVQKGAEFYAEKVRESMYSLGLQKRTGQAQQSITVSSPSTGTAEIGPSGKGFYLLFHELGFFNVRAKRWIPPKPVMGPTFTRYQKEIERTMAEEVKAGLGL